jgi:hypothetical protein
MLRPIDNPILKCQGTATAIRRRCTKRDAKLRLATSDFAQIIEHLPEPGESVHAITRGNQPLWACVGAVLTLARPATIAEMAVSTLSANATNARDLFARLDAGEIGRVWFLASDVFAAKCPREHTMLNDGLKARCQEYGIARTHAKILAMKLSDGRHVTIESSANCRSCRSIEQLTLFGDPDLLDFHAAWIRRLVEATT